MESRHVAISTHAILAIASVLILLVMLNSAWMTETLKQVYEPAFMPQLPPQTPALVFWVVPLPILITFVAHSVWYIYQVLLARTFRKAAITLQQQRKRKNDLLSINDDSDGLDTLDNESEILNRSNYSL